MKKALLLFIVLLSFHQLYAQKNILPRFIRRIFFEKDSSRRSSFIVLPALTSAPETGLEFGGSFLYSFYTDTANKRTNVSSIFGYATATTKGQNRMSIGSSYWTPSNNFHYSANVSYINFPSDFYGIGNNTRLADKDHVDEKRFKLTFDGERKLGHYVYLGFVAGELNYRYGDKEANGIFTTDSYIEEKFGGNEVYAGPSFLFDSRDRNTYATRGIIVTSYLNIMHGLFANNNYKGAFFNLEYSQFFPLSKRFVLGLDVQTQNLLGGSSPFYLMPALGNDEIMRGYYNGRYRDRNLLVGQTELRYRISDRFGAAVFTGTGEVFHDSFSLNQLKPNYGGGLRYFFDVEKGLAVRMDYGFGQKVPGEPRQSGLYLSLGQSF